MKFLGAYLLSFLNFIGAMKFVETPSNYLVGGQFNPVNGADLTVTANVVTPTGLVSNVAAAGGLIKTITVPWVGFGGTIYLIAGTTPYTWDATGNIALAGTSTAANRCIPFTYHAANAKWYPTVVA